VEHAFWYHVCLAEAAGGTRFVSDGHQGRRCVTARSSPVVITELCEAGTRSIESDVNDGQ
jgi:hypothetical protein